MSEKCQNRKSPSLPNGCPTYTAAPGLSIFGANISTLLQLSRAGGRPDGEARTGGAPPSNGTQGANEGKTCACGSRFKKRNCNSQTRIGRSAGAASRYVRGSSGYQQHARRAGAGFQEPARERDPRLRGQVR